jgi:hypothetical protein
VQTPANPSNTIVGRERDGRPWFEAISLTCRVGTLPLKTAEDASSSGENCLLWSTFHRGEPQTPDFGFVVVGATDSPGPHHYVANPVSTGYNHCKLITTGDDFNEDGVEPC